jgi:hypothetical protein
MQHLPIIQDPSDSKSLPRKVMDGLLNTALVNPKQIEYVDGLIMNETAGSRKASTAPIRAVGSYVGAPVAPKGKSDSVYAPKTKTSPGVRYPVGQN